MMRRSSAAASLTAWIWLISSLCPALLADVVSYTTLDDDGVILLSSVTVRDGMRERIYDGARLNAARVVHFLGCSRLTMIAPGGRVDGPSRLNVLDRVLNSGLLNPGGTTVPMAPAAARRALLTIPGILLEFTEPLVNRPGDDLVVFEAHRRLGSKPGGDPFRILPILSDGTAGTWQTIERHDVDLDHPKVKSCGSFTLYAAPSPCLNTEQLLSCTLRPSGQLADFSAMSTGIDLSRSGCPDGAAVHRILIQNVTPGEPSIDLVCVAGLPEPVSENLLEREPTLTKAPIKPVLPAMLSGPLAGIEDIVFAVRRPGRDHWYANFGFYSAPQREYPKQRAPDGKVTLPKAYKDGGRLCLLRIRTGEVAHLLDDAAGAVRDPVVHYDGKTVLFSYRPGGTDFYHLYTISTNGSGLTQLTDGPYNDIEPVYTPAGAILFCSDRARRYVNCWRSPVATVHRCEGDGSSIRMLSPNVEHDNTPWMMRDGRVIYMRWEYVDRNQNVFHHLWTMNPDGSAQMVYFGNQHPGIAMLDAKPIPGTDQVVASFSPGHGRAEHAGYVTAVSVSRGPDHLSSARRISRGGPVYRDPFPVSPSCFIVACDGDIQVMDGKGKTQTVYSLPASMQGAWVHEPRPVQSKQPEPVIPSRVELSERTGTLVLSDVYQGRQMAGVRRGEIKRLLVLEQLPKPVNFSGGMWPISAGGTFTLARILGTVPVAADGSAHMRVPALRSLFFVALDEHDRSVKRMQSFVTVQPGEVTGCVGCHESRVLAPPADTVRPLAALSGPVPVTPLPNIPAVPDFPRDVQPVLDRHCVRCHNPASTRSRINLTGDMTPLFSTSYWALTQHGMYADGRNEPRGNLPPRQFGSSASRLLEFLEGRHHGVKVSDSERRIVWAWIEASAPFAGTYAALGSGIFPVNFPDDVVKDACATCHGRPAGPKPVGGMTTYYRFGKKGPHLPLADTAMTLQGLRAQTGYYKFGNARPPQSLCNLSRPEFSLLLRAHLATSAGGLELGGKVVFRSADDPAYQALLTAIDAARSQLLREGRFGLPGFRPNDYYLYQMKRYGALPDRYVPAAPVDPYQLDRDYWALFHWRGDGESR